MIGHARAGRSRRIWWVLLAVVVVIALVVLAYRTVLAGSAQPVVDSSPVAVELLDPEPVTPALDFSGFNAAEIISDQIFYDSTTMDRDAISLFLADVNAGCRTGADGTPCVAEYVEDTVDFVADDFCFAFQGAEGDTVADIIAKAATSCGINPQVLLVMLQKEQGLLTASGTGLTESRYLIAMGYGCPDSANCATEYSGFANQVYHAARQLRMYANQPTMYTYLPYQVNQVAYSPDPDCGSSAVEIQNSATAGLYNYTPYQPDAAALSGNHGACSSSGNLNFYGYFQAWFSQ